MSSQVAIALDSGLFYGGQPLSGTVNVTVNSAQDVLTYLQVQVNVSSTVCIHRDDFFSPIGINSENHDVNEQPIERQQHQEIYINIHTVFDQPRTLPSGTHSIRFETTLPLDLPPSAVDQVTTQSYGRIDFTATAKLGAGNARGPGVGGEIAAQTAFEYLPHMYVGSSNERFDLTEEQYFPFEDSDSDEDDYEVPRCLPSPTVDEMRELLDDVPMGKIEVSVNYPLYHMRQDQVNHYYLSLKQLPAYSPLSAEFSQLFMQEVITLRVKNFKIMHKARKCQIPYTAARLQDRDVRFCLEYIKPDAQLVPSFYSLNYRHTYKVVGRIKMCRNFMGRQEDYEDDFYFPTDVLSTYATEMSNASVSASRRPVIMRPLSHIMQRKICVCELKSNYTSDQPEVTYTRQQLST